VLWKPVPLKATPTGENTLRAGAPHDGQQTSSLELIERVTSNALAHTVHLKSYAGIEEMLLHERKMAREVRRSSLHTISTGGNFASYTLTGL